MTIHSPLTRSSGVTYSVISLPAFSFTVTSLFSFDDDHNLTPAVHLRRAEDEKDNLQDLTSDAIFFFFGRIN